MSADDYFDSLQKIIKLFHQLSGATFGLRFFFGGGLQKPATARRSGF